ncbi:MAG: PIN domain nuclease [Planctomycetia bacterium]|nr:PIN domain nuclease [Planctomycetia bacterium]
MPTSGKPVALVVADANVLLSAIVGGAAATVFAAPGLTVHVAEPTLDEVARYASSMAARKGLDAGIVALALAAPPATVHPAASYVGSLAEAARRLRGRDVDNADVLALALHLDAPVWSNDHDFDGTGIEVHTTARLLKRLGL